MDEDLRRLERAAEADPTSLDLLGSLARSSERAGWTLDGMSLGEHVAALIVREADTADAFLPRGEDLETIRRLGARVVPALVESFGGSQLATCFRAGLALGDLGSRAAAAIPALIEGLFRDHPLIRLHARWTLARLAPASLTALMARLRADPERLDTLLDAVVYQGRLAESALSLLEGWAAEGRPEEQVQALVDASDLVAGRGQPKTPQRISGPSSWCWGEGTSSDLRAFDLSVWSWEVASVMHGHAAYHDLNSASAWLEDELRSPLEALKRWRPHDVVLHAPAVRLTHFDHDLGGVADLARLESPNGRDFTRGELFFAAEQARGEPYNPDARGVSMDLQVPRKDCPTYFVAVDST